VTPFVLSLSKDERLTSNSNSPGVARQLVTSLLSRQKKVTKEKATPVRRPFGLPCGTRADGRLRNSPPAEAQTVLADFPRPLCVPRRTHRDPRATAKHPLIRALLPVGERYVVLFWLFLSSPFNKEGFAQKTGNCCFPLFIKRERGGFAFQAGASDAFCFLFPPATILYSNNRHSRLPLNNGVRLLADNLMSLARRKSAVRK
jgi:hypothetical protein